MQEKRINVNQVELQIREYEHEGDVVIFLHFGGANLMMWQRVIPYFQPHYHLVLVDIRGHGKSDKLDFGYHRKLSEEKTAEHYRAPQLFLNKPLIFLMMRGFFRGLGIRFGLVDGAVRVIRGSINGI